MTGGVGSGCVRGRGDGLRWDRSWRWVPAGDAGMPGARRARDGGWARLGMCSGGRADVFSFGGDVFSFGPNVFSFWRGMCSISSGMCPLWRPDVVQFLAVQPLVGDAGTTDGSGRDSSAPLRPAHRMTTAGGPRCRSGCGRGRDGSFALGCVHFMALMCSLWPGDVFGDDGVRGEHVIGEK